MTQTLISHLPLGGGWEGANMKYIKPSIQVDEAQAAQMLAESLIISSSTTVDGSQALTKEEVNWDIWGEE